MYGLNTEDIRIITDTLRQFPQVREAIIFGSRALGTYKTGSDVDIALKGNQIDQCLSDISAYLNESSPLPYYFDILDYDSITNENSAIISTASEKLFISKHHF